MGEAGWRDHSGATVKCGVRIVRIVKIESLKFSHILALKAVVTFGPYFKWPVYLVKQRGARVLLGRRSGRKSKDVLFFTTFKDILTDYKYITKK